MSRRKRIAAKAAADGRPTVLRVEPIPREVLEFEVHNTGKNEVVARDMHRYAQIYDISQLLFIQAWTEPGWVFLECGANIGTHAIFYARCCRAARVTAFEPMASTRKILERNVERNGCARQVDVLPFALSDKPGRGDYRHKVTHRVSATRIKEQDGGEVEIRTVDSFKFQVVDVIKIDCEDHSTRALQGAADTIRRCQPKVIGVEAKGNELPPVLEVLGPLGYVQRYMNGRMTRVFLHESVLT